MRNCCLTLSLILLIAAPVAAEDGASVSASPARGRQVAQAKTEKGKGNKPESGSTISSPMSGDAEQEVLTFVREHHPELVKLLSQLSESRPKEYQKALRDLSRVRDRLGQVKRNHAERYELELAVWKTESRIQLLAARMHMGGSDELRDELRTALEEQAELKLGLLRLERSVAQDRLNKIDAQIKRLDQDRSHMIERQLQAITTMAQPSKIKTRNDKN
jgi:flagellar motor protein MotB